MPIKLFSLSTLHFTARNTHILVCLTERDGKNESLMANMAIMRSHADFLHSKIKHCIVDVETLIRD